MGIIRQIVLENRPRLNIYCCDECLFSSADHAEGRECFLLHRITGETVYIDDEDTERYVNNKCPLPRGNNNE